MTKISSGLDRHAPERDAGLQGCQRAASLTTSSADPVNLGPASQSSALMKCWQVRLLIP